MLQGALENILNVYLAPYVDGFDGKSLKMSIFSGTVELNNLKIKKNFFQLIGIDFLEVESGAIGKIKLTIGSWSNLTSGEVGILIQGVDVRLRAVEAKKKGLAEQVGAVGG